MYHLPDTLYEEKMPRRAKRLFVDTFSQHHKLNAGDEDVAMEKARQAVEQRYVRVNDLQWIPRRAAYEIVRDDMSSDSDIGSGVDDARHNGIRRNGNGKRRVRESSDGSSDSSTDDEIVSKKRTTAAKKKRVDKTVSTFVDNSYSSEDEEND